jgi:hypothetical protein
MLAQRYEVGLANAPREEAERRLAVCRNKCGDHFVLDDAPDVDRCKKCRVCSGTAGIVFVQRLTGEMPPVDGCPWGTKP